LNALFNIPEQVLAQFRSSSVHRQWASRTSGWTHFGSWNKFFKYVEGFENFHALIFTDKECY